jgi:acetyl-CoA C-acetyltransferase
MEEVFIINAKRTPIGSFNGSLSSIPAPKLGSIAIKGVIENTGISNEQIDEVIMGNVLTAGEGQAPARQSAIYAGLSKSTPCMTINKVCGSGLKAVMLACDSIKLGNSSIVVAGGMENMSLAPHLLENSRAGYKMGNFQVTDSMIKDGLWDPYNNFHMGNAAEICVKKYQFTREEQDNFAIRSYKRALESIEKGYFKNEIVTVEVTQKKGETLIVNKDEEPFKAKIDKIPTLKPAFEKEGTITAANASSINDGAAALLLASSSRVKELNLKPIAKVIEYSTHAQEPEWFTTAPVYAIQKVCKKANINLEDIDLFEINEAFSAVTMAAIKELNLDIEKVNVHGGAVSLGHPIGASGARILTTLIYALKIRNKKYGLATLCIGGGEAVALIVENL